MDDSIATIHNSDSGDFDGEASIGGFVKSFFSSSSLINASVVVNWVPVFICLTALASDSSDNNLVWRTFSLFFCPFQEGLEEFTRNIDGNLSSNSFPCRIMKEIAQHSTLRFNFLRRVTKSHFALIHTCKSVFLPPKNAPQSPPPPTQNNNNNIVVVVSIHFCPGMKAKY